MNKKRRKIWSVLLALAMILTSVVQLDGTSKTVNAATNSSFTLYYYAGEDTATFYMDIYNDSAVEFASDTETEDAFGWGKQEGKLQSVENNAGWYAIKLNITGDSAAGGFDIRTGSTDDDKVATYSEWTNDTDYAVLVGGSKSAYAIKAGTLYSDLSEAGLTDVTSGEGEETEPSTAVEASITVKKVEGLSTDFVHGVDVSSYLSLIQSGVKYYDEEGKEADLFDILENAGVNYVRLRVWNSPYPLDSEGNNIYVEEDGTTTHAASEIANTVKNELGYNEYYLEDGTQVYMETYGAGVCDVDTAVVIGKIATAHNMKVLVDFHYSDFWADPKKKSVPKTWETMSLEEKAIALGQFTEDSLNTMLDAGVDVGMVQIGNEINNGMAGENDSSDVYTLLKSASAAVRSVSKDILIAVHFTDPQSEGYQLNRAAELEEAGVDYDAFGTSFYPFWHGTADTLYQDLKEISDKYGKKVYVAEISYAWTLDDGDGYGNVVYDGAGDQEYNYSIDVEGQATAVRDAIAAVSKIGENGLGTFYWEPAWIPVNYAYNEDGSLNETAYAANQKAWKLYGSGWATVYANEYDPEVVDDNNGGTWENQAFFDFNGHVLDSINVYKWVYTGAEGPLKVSKVEAVTSEMTYHTTADMPKTVKVNLNDGSSLDVSVVWNDEQVKALESADFGDYTVEGTVGAFSYESKGETITVAEGVWKASCTVTVTGTNYVTNGSFETGDDTGWTLTNYLGENVGWPSVDKSSANAKSGRYYYKAWNEGSIDFSIDQTISTNPSAGLYTLYAYYQGTGVDELLDTSKLYATVTYLNGETQTYQADVEIHNVWKDFYQARVGNIIINDNVASVTVGTRLSCTATELGAWVVVDDISLMRVGDLAKADETIGAVAEQVKKPADNKPADKTSGETTNTEKEVTVKLNATKLPLQIKKSVTLKATVKNDTVKSWKSSNKKVATVKNGKVTAKKVGKATITVTTKTGKTAKCVVTVQKKAVKAKKLTLSSKSIVLEKGKSVTLKVTKNPISATDKLTWSSSNKKVATVKKGKVTAKKAGKTTITVKTSKGKKATCKVTVK
jgi:arabinogalactan endo-1,4-beta-galactosidase